MTTAVFGGSFNPPHLAHEMACLIVLETGLVDRVLMVPVYRHPFDKQLVPFEHRFAMCQLAAQAFAPGQVEVSRVEAELGAEHSRTLDTLERLSSDHPDERFRLVVGADILGEVAKWYRWDEIVRRAPPIVVGRAGYAMPAPGPDATAGALPGATAGALPGATAGAPPGMTPDARLAQSQLPPALVLPSVSSTEIRARLSRGQAVEGLVSRRVAEYIRTHHLYGGSA